VIFDSKPAFLLLFVHHFYGQQMAGVCPFVVVCWCQMAKHADTARPSRTTQTGQTMPRQGQGIQNASGGHCWTRTDGTRQRFNDADDTLDSFGKD